MENIKYYYVEIIQLFVGSNNNLVLNLKTQKSKNETENSIGIAFLIIIIQKNLATEEIKS